MDEIYAELSYEEEFCSIASFDEVKDQCIVINGFSKAYAMTGYRIGWLASHDKDLITAVKRLQGQTISCATTIAQKAAEGDKEAKKQFDYNNDVLYMSLSSRKMVLLFTAFYCNTAGKGCAFIYREFRCEIDRIGIVNSYVFFIIIC